MNDPFEQMRIALGDCSWCLYWDRFFADGGGVFMHSNEGVPVYGPSERSKIVHAEDSLDWLRHYSEGVEGCQGAVYRLMDEVAALNNPMMPEGHDIEQEIEQRGGPRTSL